MTHEEATWHRLELQCIRTLMGMGFPAAAGRAHASKPGEGATAASPGSPVNFGGTVNAPANAIAVGAIGNAFATGVDLDGIPTTVEVNPVNSSADYIEGDGAAAGVSPRAQRILERFSFRAPLPAANRPQQETTNGQLISK
jgi:hypothetical protein